jgi:hypothetical protein
MKHKILFGVMLFLLVPAISFSYTLVRKDGRTFSGELVSKTDQTVVIRDSRGITVKFKADQVDWNKTKSEDPDLAKKEAHELKFQEQNIERNQVTRPTQWTGENFRWILMTSTSKTFSVLLQKSAG